MRTLHRAIVLTAIMALLGAGAYLITHEEAEWEKYSDEEFGFSFSYPPDWDLEHGDIPEGLLGTARRGVVVLASKGGMKAMIEAREENLTLTLDELREKHLIMWENFYLEIIEEENCEVSGVPAIRWRIVDGGSQEVVIAVKDDMWYRLATVAPLDDYPGETFGRIMASFIFWRGREVPKLNVLLGPWVLIGGHHERRRSLPLEMVIAIRRGGK